MSDQEEVYEVEAIQDKRVQNGVLQYFVKWLGYSNDDSTWERASNLNCEDLIHAYEEKQLKQREVRVDKAKEGTEKVKRPAKLSPQTKLFDAGVEPETFTGIVSIDGEYYVFVQFPGDAEQEVVALTRLKTKWPQQLIRFLEKKLVVGLEKDDDEDEEADDQPVSSQSSAPSSIAGSSSSRCDDAIDAED